MLLELKPMNTAVELAIVCYERQGSRETSKGEMQFWGKKPLAS